MEDEVIGALSSIPADQEQGIERFLRLKSAGEDIQVLAEPAAAILRRAG